MPELDRLTVLDEDGVLKIDEPFPGTPYFEELDDFDFYGDDPVIAKEAQVEVKQMPKELVYIPGLLLLVVVYLIQRARAGREKGVPA